MTGLHEATSVFLVLFCNIFIKKHIAKYIKYVRIAFGHFIKNRDKTVYKVFLLSSFVPDGGLIFNSWNLS